MDNKKALGLVLAFLVLLTAGFFWWVKQPGFRPETGPATPTPFPPPDWKNYRQPTFGYSLFYPPDWKLQEQGAINDRTLDLASFFVSVEGKRMPVIQIKVSSLPYQEELGNRDIRGSGFGEGRPGDPVLIGGVEGVRVVGQSEEGNKLISLFLPGGNQTFILLGSPEVIPGQDQTELINEVFSTLKLP